MGELARLQVAKKAPAMRKWEGGRVRQDRHGKDVWVIEGTRSGVRYTITLDVTSQKHALGQLANFDADPAGYLQATRKTHAPAAKGVRLDGETLEAFRVAFEPTVGAKHAANTMRYLEAWLRVLRNRDMSTIQLKDYHHMLQGLEPRRHHITSLRSLTSWLRKTGRLARGQDASLDLEVPQTNAKREDRDVGYPAEDVEKVYAAIVAEYNRPRHLMQGVRDVIAVKAFTGAHYTEIVRIAKGTRKVRPVTDGGEIVGVVVFPHKSGLPHPQSLGREAFNAVMRLKAAGSAPSESFVLAVLAKASRLVGLSYEMKLGELRHTFISECLGPRGREVRYQGGGVSLDTMRRVVGHTSTRTTEIYNSSVPPLAVPAITLRNEEDPK